MANDNLQIKERHDEIYNRAVAARERGDYIEFERIKQEELYPFREKYNFTVNIKTQEQESQGPKQESKTGAPAPVLTYNGDKWHRKGTYKKDENPNGYFFYQVPMKLLDYIYQMLDGKNGLAIKIMTVLIGTAEGFGVSEKWICDRIGVDTTNKNSTAAYRRARTRLCEMEWLTLDKATHKLFINYDYLWEQAYTLKENGDL